MSKNGATGKIAAVAIALSATAFVLVAGEFLARAFPFPVKTLITLENGYRAEPFGYSFAPHMTQVYQLGDHFETIVTDGSGLVFQQEPPSGTAASGTILFIGDSFTAGSSEASFPAMVHRILSDQESVRVVNGGVRGYDGEAVFEWFDARGKAYEPDVVVYGFFFNDVTAYGQNKTWRIGASSPHFLMTDPAVTDIRFENGLIWSRPFDTGRFIKKNSALFKVFQRYWSPPQPYGLPMRDGFVREMDPTLSAGEEQALTNILERAGKLRDHLRVNGGRLVVVLIPDGSEVSIDDGKARYFSRIEAFCRETGVVCVNPLDDLRAARRAGEKPYWNFVDDADAHCTPEGYRIIAERTAEAVARVLSGKSQPPLDLRETPDDEAGSRLDREWDAYGKPGITRKGDATLVAVKGAPGGVKTQLPVKQGETVSLTIQATATGAASIRFRDGEELAYFPVPISGKSVFIVAPRADNPELLIYADTDMQIIIDGLSIGRL